jgi:hypothetical protein
MLDKYLLKKVRLNKKLKEKLGIKISGYPSIIIRE